MNRSLRITALCMAAIAMAAVAPSLAAAQVIAPHAAANAFDLALTYAPERAKIVDTPCDCFWFQGGGADAALTFYRGLGLAASLTGQHASGLTGGASLDKIDYLFGPRYTLHTTGRSETARYSTRLFGEALFGGVHGFNGTFPASSTAVSSANAFAYQLGGGLDLVLTHRWAIRAFEASFHHSGLPNSAANTQDDFRLATGVSFWIGKQ